MLITVCNVACQCVAGILNGTLPAVDHRTAGCAGTAALGLNPQYVATNAGTITGKKMLVK